MITKFKEYFQMSLNESALIYSDKFKKILSNIDSPVAKGLLEIENQDLKVPNNYFDVDDDKEESDFIPDRKAQEIIKPENKEKFVIYLW
jgi:hypothetical protein